jgi:hypothetical protein
VCHVTPRQTCKRHVAALPAVDTHTGASRMHRDGTQACFTWAFRCTSTGTGFVPQLSGCPSTVPLTHRCCYGMVCLPITSFRFIFVSHSEVPRFFRHVRSRSDFLHSLRTSQTSRRPLNTSPFCLRVTVTSDTGLHLQHSLFGCRRTQRF